MLNLNLFDESWKSKTVELQKKFDISNGYCNLYLYQELSESPTPIEKMVYEQRDMYYRLGYTNVLCIVNNHYCNTTHDLNKPTDAESWDSMTRRLLSNLSPIEICLLGYMELKASYFTSYRMSNEGRFFVSVKELSENMGINDTFIVNDIIQRLSDIGLIEIVSSAYKGYKCKYFKIHDKSPVTTLMLIQLLTPNTEKV